MASSQGLNKEGLRKRDEAEMCYRRKASRNLRFVSNKENRNRRKEAEIEKAGLQMMERGTGNDRLPVQ